MVKWEKTRDEDLKIVETKEVLALVSEANVI